jgi:intracellular septation protein A
MVSAKETLSGEMNILLLAEALVARFLNKVNPKVLDELNTDFWVDVKLIGLPASGEVFFLQEIINEPTKAIKIKGLVFICIDFFN